MIKRSNKLRLWVPSVVLVLVLTPAFEASADGVGTPVAVVVSRQDAATMSIPRWKAFMHPTQPDRIWLGLANWGYTGGDQLVNTTDGGATWNRPTIYFDADWSLDYHMSLAGDASGNIYAVYPEASTVQFRKVNYPAQSNSDLDPPRTVRSFYGAANVMVEPSNQRVWVFTRLGENPSENVRYAYTDNAGVSWTSGQADATGHTNVRIGSMPYIDGRPALVVLYINSTMGYRYYLWNGSAFEARPDAQIYTGNVGTQRCFAHNVTGGEYMHLVFGLNDQLHHYWKQYNGGTGSWNHQVIDQSSYTTQNEWETTCSARGEELFAIYRKKTSSSLSSGEIYYAKWTQATQTWTSPVEISVHPSNTDNHWPNSAMQIPLASDFIPVFWYSHLGSNNEQIYFNKITLDVSEDITPPDSIDDLQAVPGSSPGEVDLDWTAPGDDGAIGTADLYELRRSDQPITPATWSSATLCSGLPPPGSSGEGQLAVATSLPEGEVVFFGLKAYDEAGNVSPLSNAASSYAAGIRAPTPGSVVEDIPSGSIQLSCDTVDSYLSLVYEFALDTEPTFGQARTLVDLSASTVASVWFDQIEPGETYYWRCRGLASSSTDSSDWSDSAIYAAPMDVDDDEGYADGYPEVSLLVGNSPSPFLETTQVRFGLSQRASAILDVFNVLGQHVDRLIDREMPAGWHTVTWDGKDQSGSRVSSGIYFFRLQAGETVDTKKTVMMK
jgi:hypothetical protein